MTTNPPEPTAAQAYESKRGDIARLVDVLEMHLEINDGQHAERPADWAIVGNLAKVRADLVGTVAFLANMKPQDVEEFLRDAV